MIEIMNKIQYFFSQLGLNGSIQIQILFLLIIAFIAFYLIKAYGRINRRRLSKELAPYINYIEINRILNNYISIHFQNISPDRETEPIHSLKSVSRAPIIPFFINKIFKSNSANKFYLVLADSGMGKTTFLLNLYFKYKLKVRRNKSNIKYISFRHPNLEESINQISKKENTILLLDGLDEDFEASRNLEHRLNTIVNMVYNFKYVIITSRTQYFPTESEEPYELKIQNTNNKNQFVFHKLYISPFSNSDIDKYLNLKYGKFRIWNYRKRRTAKSIINKIPNLIARPIFLRYLDQIHFEGDLNKYSYQLYELTIDLWIERELGKVSPKGSKDYRKNMLFFLSNVAKYIYKYKNSGHDISRDNLEQIAIRSNLNLDELKFSNLSLLNRDASNWKFSHKSFLDYFLAVELFNDNEFKDTFDFKGFDYVKVLYEEMVEYYRKESSTGETLSVSEVFGISNKLIASYHEREEIDEKFKEALNLDKHIIIYGSSKQGKTSLFKKHLSKDNYIVVNCSRNYELINIYKSILRQNNILITESITQEEGQSHTTSGTIKAKIKIPIAEAQSELSESERHENKKAVKYETIDYDIDKAQDIIEILKSVRFHKRIILENFHYLSEHTQNDLAFDLRNFQDEGIYFVILGIWRESNRLCQYNRDLLERIYEIPVEPWEKRDFLKVMKKGSRLLRVNMEDIIEDLIEASFDSIGVFQELCKEACINARSDDSFGIVNINNTHLDNAIDKKLSDYSNSHIRSFEAFSSLDERYNQIPFFFIKTLFAMDYKEIEKGISRVYIEEQISKYFKESNLENNQNITKFLKRIKEYQLSKRISPPLFGYSLDLSKVYIIDSTLYFFLKHCDSKTIIDEIKP